MTVHAVRQLFARAGQPLPDVLAPVVPLAPPAGPSPWEGKQEEAIHKAIMQWLDLQGWPYLRARMDKRSPFPEGWPDFTVFLPGGLTVFLEVKTPTGKVTTKQAEILAKLDGAGFATCVPRSDLAAIEWLRVQAAISVDGCITTVKGSPAGR